MNSDAGNLGSETFQPSNSLHILPCLTSLMWWKSGHSRGWKLQRYLYLIGAFCRKDQHRESQGTHSEDGEQSNIRILYRRTEGCPSEPVQTGSVGLGQQRNINTNSWFTCFPMSQSHIHSGQRKSKQMAKGSGRKRGTNTSDYKTS